MFRVGSTFGKEHRGDLDALDYALACMGIGKPICAPMDGEEIDEGGTFSSGDDGPPAHPRCRCWLDTRTRIND